MKYRRFTPQEDQILRDHYWSLGGSGVRRLYLPYFTGMQINSRAAHIGIKANPALHGQHVRNNEDLTPLTKIETPFAAYMLGLLWADGTVRKNSYCVTLKIVETDFNDIQDRWLATGSWRTYRAWDGNPAHQPAVIASINHKGWHAFLVQHDYLFKSGYSADAILRAVPPPLKHYWWRGYFDGDGGMTVHRKTHRVHITSCKEQDWSFLDDLMRSLGCVYSMRRSEVPIGSSSVSISDEANLRRFMDYIYAGEQFGLSRKRQLYEAYLHHKRTCRPNKTSRFRGVCMTRGRWLMQIYSNTLKRSIRRWFLQEEDAAREYDNLALQMFGPKAVLNFPIAS